MPQLSLSYREKSRWLLLTDLETILATICLLKLLEPNKLGYVRVTWLLLPPSVTLFSSISLPPLSLFLLFVPPSHFSLYVQSCSYSQTSITQHIYTESNLCWGCLSLAYIKLPLPLSLSPGPRHGSTSGTSSSDSSSSSDSESSGEEGEVLPSPPKGRDTTLQNPFVMDFDVSVEPLHTVH